MSIQNATGVRLLNLCQSMVVIQEGYHVKSNISEQQLYLESPSSSSRSVWQPLELDILCSYCHALHWLMKKHNHQPFQYNIYDMLFKRYSAA